MRHVRPLRPHLLRAAPLAAALGLCLAGPLGGCPAASAQGIPITDSGEGWVGEPISIEVKDAQLTDFLRLVAHVSGRNLVVDPAVAGKTITLTLHDVPWDQALDLVSRTHGLSAVADGNVLRVAPTAKLTAESQQIAQYREARENAGPLRTWAYSLSNANASQVEPLVRKALTPRGSLSVDRRTNTLIVQDIRPPDPAFVLLEDASAAPAPRPGAAHAGAPLRAEPAGLAVRVYEVAAGDGARDGAGRRLLATGLLARAPGARADLAGVTVTTAQDGGRLVLTARGAGRGAWMDAASAGSLAVTAADGGSRLVVVEPIAG